MLVKMERENGALKAKLHEVSRLLEGAANTQKHRAAGRADRGRPSSADRKLRLANKNLVRVPPRRPPRASRRCARKAARRFVRLHTHGEIGSGPCPNGARATAGCVKAREREATAQGAWPPPLFAASVQYRIRIQARSRSHQTRLLGRLTTSCAAGGLLPPGRPDPAARERAVGEARRSAEACG